MSDLAAASPVGRARALAEELLRPPAEAVDRSVVPRSHLDALGRAGLLGLAGPRSHGGAQAAPAVVREVTEELAGACGATWFVWAQHAMPLAVLTASENAPLRDRLLPGMCTGELLAGIAVAHLRRSSPPAVTATREAGGWRFDGRVGWMTSWGLCDVLLLGGRTDDGRTVQVLVPAREASGLTATGPMALAAMQASQTVALQLDGLAVRDVDVASVSPTSEWDAHDAARTANAGPHTFGLQREAVRRLDELAAQRGDGTAAALAQQLRREGERLRRVAYVLLDDVPEQEQVEDRLAVRAAALELVVRTATALVVATGGSGMSLDAAPQRLAREAVFHLVQAQTSPVREATLQLLREAS